MPSLSSLIVQRQVATIVEVEQAIARQVIHGGDLVTNLLEVAPQAEHSLTRVLAESLGIPSVPPGRLPAPDNEALDIIPVESALRYGVFPLRLSAKTLVIATSERLNPTAAHDLTRTLGLDVSLVAAPLIRIREGIAAHYGVPLEPRQLRLVQRLDGVSEGTGIHPPRAAHPRQLPGSPSILPSGISSGVSSRPQPMESKVPTTRRKVSTLEMARVQPPGESPGELRVVEVTDEASADEPSSAIDPPPLVEPLAADLDEGSLVEFPEGDGAFTEPRSSGFLSEPPEDAAEEDAALREDAVEVGATEEPSAAEVTAEASYADAAAAHAEQLAAQEGDMPFEPIPVTEESPGAAEHEPAQPELAPGEDAYPAPGIDWRDAADLQQDPAATRTDSEPILTEGGPVPGDSPRPPGMVNRRAMAHLLKREVASTTRNATTRSARKKGPFSRSDAERELDAARTPEDVLDTFFAFGSQFFEYSALFVVHGEIVEGRDAWGPGADHLRVLGLGVPLDLPSSLSAVRRDAHVLLSRFDDLDLDRELRRDLERSRARPLLAALVPLTVKGRSVAMLYGDDGQTDVTLTSLGDLLGFSALASSQLERLALARKSQHGRFSGLASPRVQASTVAALARAFSLPLPTEHGGSRSSEARREPGSSAPAHVGPGISPGANSVHPPAWREPGSWHDEVVIPGAAQSEGLTARVDPALAATAIPTLDDLERLPLLTRVVEPAARPDPASEAAPDLGPDTPFPRSVAGPVQVVLTEQDAPIAPTRGEEPHAGADGRPRFTRPIPRVDDDDASALVAEHVEQSDRPGRSSPPLRQSMEPESQTGRVGSYHLVPRPPDTRIRGDSGGIQQLLERATAGGLEGEEALSELLRKAEHEFPQLVERFPGPLVVDRLRARADLPLASECGPLLKVLVTMRRGALPFMTVRSTSVDVEQRFWATHVLGELLLPEASNAILPRLFDEDVAVRRVARRAAQALATAGAPGEPLKHSLAHTMRSPDEAMQRRLLAIEALSEIRVPSVVPILIPALLDESDAIVDAARTALMVVTRQDLGRNPQVWSAWWERHKGEHRMEWLIQALTHDVASIRRTAGDELKLLTREYFGYYDDLPPKERERAQARYLQWWRDEGQYRFR